MSEIKEIDPIVGEKYEYANGPFPEKKWTRPLYFIGKVPPPCINGQYKYLAYLETAGCSSSIGWFEFIREVTQSKEPIKYKDVLESLRSDDEVIIRLYGEGLRLRVSGKYPEFYGQLFNGLWGMDLTHGYKNMKYNDFKIVEINDVEVLPPSQTQQL